MPTSNDMQKVLDIQDKNIIFKDNCVTYGVFKGRRCKFIECTLSYTPKECQNCQIPNQDYTIYKNGTQTSRITFPMSGIVPTFLRMKKQRFMCKACKETFTAQTPLVENNCFISTYIKAHILTKSADACSIKDISKETNVSEATVQRVITKEAKHYRPHNQSLPKHMSFDEFKYASGRMAFEYINAQTGDILDILPAKDSRFVKKHFTSNYSLRQRERVETVTVDMNASYVSFIPVLFPKAHIIIDRFHIVQLVNRSMNRTRVKVMNQFNTSNGEDLKKYRRLKHYWKKMLKKESELSYTTYKSYKLFGQRLESAIVSDMLAYDKELETTYRVYQSIIKAVEENDHKRLESIVTQSYSSDLSSYMKTSLKTLRKHLKMIKNTFEYPYNNGRIEGINNKIKVLNRVAYGYRNFLNYKNRIILHFNLNPTKTKVNQKKKVNTKAA